MKTCEHCGGLIATEDGERIAGTLCRCGFAAVDVLGDACEKLLSHMGYDTWTDEHLETGLERAFAPEILEEIRLVKLAREALRMTNHLRINSPNTSVSGPCPPTKDDTNKN